MLYLPSINFLVTIVSYSWSLLALFACTVFHTIILLKLKSPNLLYKEEKLKNTYYLHLCRLIGKILTICRCDDADLVHCGSESRVQTFRFDNSHVLVMFQIVILNHIKFCPNSPVILYYSLPPPLLGWLYLQLSKLMQDRHWNPKTFTKFERET